MFNLLDEDNLRIIGNVLDKIKALKILKEHGITSGIHKFECDPDMEGFNDEDFGDAMLHKLIGEHGTPRIANGEDGDEEFKDFDPDEYTIYKVDIRHPIIQEYYNLCKSKNIDCMTEDYCKLVTSAIDTPWGCDYVWHELYVPKDESISLVLIYTDHTFFNSWFISSYYKIIDYCKNFIERNKNNGEFNKEQCSN